MRERERKRKRERVKLCELCVMHSSMESLDTETADSAQMKLLGIADGRWVEVVSCSFPVGLVWALAETGSGRVGGEETGSTVEGGREVDTAAAFPFGAVFLFFAFGLSRKMRICNM